MEKSVSLSTYYYSSPLGRLMINADQEFVRSILFDKQGEDPGGRNAEAEGAPELVRQSVRQLKEYFEGERRKFDFPFHQSGTAFQESVWDELLKIPYGKTISYMELSRRIGNPKAIRAVGTTNGKNQLVIVVPCHRVIGSNGDLTGYGGELWRKKWLLEHEGKWAGGIQKLF